jgi:hypothetical protein
MRLYGTRSTKETVDLALRRLAGSRLGTEEALALKGSGWEGASTRDVMTHLRTPRDGPGWYLYVGGAPPRHGQPVQQLDP